MLRGRGYVYSALIFIADILLGGLFGCTIAVLSAAYAFLVGEWFARKKYRAILCNMSSNNQKEKLQRCFLRVITKAKQKYAHVPGNTKIYIIPDQKIQAYAFGWHSIGVTEGALDLDTRTLEALIAHEYGHIVNGDSVLNMVMSASAVGLVAILALYQFAFITAVYLFVIIACLIGLFRFNFISYMVTTKFTGLIKKVGEIVQHGALSLFQIFIRALGKRGELLADSFACSLGYSFYLRRFLERFDIDSARRDTFLDVLYDTHPPRDVRLQNINQEITKIEKT